MAYEGHGACVGEREQVGPRFYGVEEYDVLHNLGLCFFGDGFCLAWGVSGVVGAEYLSHGQ